MVSQDRPVSYLLRDLTSLFSANTLNDGPGMSPHPINEGAPSQDVQDQSLELPADPVKRMQKLLQELEDLDLIAKVQVGNQPVRMGGCADIYIGTMNNGKQRMAIKKGRFSVEEMLKFVKVC